MSIRYLPRFFFSFFSPLYCSFANDARFQLIWSTIYLKYFQIVASYWFRYMYILIFLSKDERTSGKLYINIRKLIGMFPSIHHGLSAFSQTGSFFFALWSINCKRRRFPIRFNCKWSKIFLREFFWHFNIHIEHPNPLNYVGLRSEHRRYTKIVWPPISSILQNRSYDRRLYTNSKIMCKTFSRHFWSD